MIVSAKTTTLFILISFTVCISPKNIQAECIDGDCVNGQGTYIWPNGDKFVGEWTNGKRNGKGSFIWPEGDLYAGDWKNGKDNGQGDYYYPGGAEQYEVEITDAELDEFGCIQGDCVNGLGTYTWPSGAKYVGAFENGERDGLGIYSFPGGQKILGIWNNGRFVGKNGSQLSKWGG